MEGYPYQFAQRVFRGFTAAASLKEPINAEFGEVACVFRGFTAAASLKGREDARRMEELAEVFRGFTAAASLKGESVRSTLEEIREFSAVSPPRPH